jgi:hypothetical protein
MTAIISTQGHAGLSRAFDGLPRTTYGGFGRREQADPSLPSLGRRLEWTVTNLRRWLLGKDLASAFLFHATVSRGRASVARPLCPAIAPLRRFITESLGQGNLHSTSSIETVVSAALHRAAS